MDFAVAMENKNPKVKEGQAPKLPLVGNSPTGRIFLWVVSKPSYVTLGDT